MFMKKKKKPFETRFHSLNGNAAMDLHRKEDLNALAAKFVANYNPDRFDAVALRLFVQKDEPIVTIYAVDKYKQENDNYPKDKLPVKKFKLKLPFDEFIKHVKKFDLTVSNDAYDIEDILVINK
jgi:hypothetical protein